jgi:MFS family permease
MTIGAVLRTPGFLLGMVCVFALQYVDRSYAPILPLYVAEAGVDGGRVALMSGLLFSMSAAAGAAGHTVGARLIDAGRMPVLVAAGMAGGAVGAALLGALSGAVWLMAGMALLGLSIGIGLTVIYAVAARTLPAAAHGTGFGLFSSAGLSAIAVSPVTSAAVGGLSIRAVFFLDAVVMAALGVALHSFFLCLRRR